MFLWFHKNINNKQVVPPQTEPEIDVGSVLKVPQSHSVKVHIQVTCFSCVCVCLHIELDR